MGFRLLDAGHVLAQRYRLVSKLGQGGMGTVWRAEHVSLGSPVAVKLMDASIAESAEATNRFRREAKAAASLQSPHVVQIFDYGIDDTTPYIAMELLSGESLADRLGRQHTLGVSETERMISHVSRALGKAHDQGIVHRDLKPDNIFVVRNEEDEIFKVLDFGIAKTTRPETEGTGPGTRTGTMMGTPYYMSPEQAQGTKALDTRSDIWSLGVIVFECLTGVRPFESPALGDLVLRICTGAIPMPSQCGCRLAGFDDWFAKACVRDPQDRFGSVRQMSEAFKKLAQLNGIEAHTSAPEIVERAAVRMIKMPGEPANASTDPGYARTMSDRTPMSGALWKSRYGWIAVGSGFVVVLIATGAALLGMRRGHDPAIDTPINPLPASAPSGSASGAVAGEEPADAAGVADAGADLATVNVTSLPLVSATPRVAPASVASTPTPARDRDAAKPPAKAAGQKAGGDQPNWGF